MHPNVDRVDVPSSDPVLRAFERYQDRVAGARRQLDDELAAIFRPSFVDAVDAVEAVIATAVEAPPALPAHETAQELVEETDEHEEPTLASAVRTAARKESWICPTCQRSFAAKNNLRRHESAHGHGSYATVDHAVRPQGDRSDNGYAF